MQWATAIYANQSLDSPTDARWYVTFLKVHPKIQVYFSLISKDQKHECL